MPFTPEPNPDMESRTLFLYTGLPVLCGLCLLFFSLWILPGLRPLPHSLDPGLPGERIRLTDRHGTLLSLTREEPFNTSDLAELDAIPLLLRQALVLAEDQRFFSHSGTDWLAVSHALFQNLRAGRSIRGASSITEQVIRILHPRPRTLRSRILESLEARLLEKKVSKAEILAFYLNQVPYPDRCRGVVQAARTLFDRDLATLGANEILTLAILPRAPQALHPENHPERLALRLQGLALRMKEAGLLEERAFRLATQVPAVRRAELAVEAPFFVRFVRENLQDVSDSRSFLLKTGLKTSLDGPLQNRIQSLLDSRVSLLQQERVLNGAVLVIAHETGEIRAWAVAGNGDSRSGGRINAVLTPRQPGSTLKPFAYAMALEKGWTAASPIADTPISTAVGRGLHDYQNYSRNAYGLLPLRDALANSLNLAAVRTVRHVGIAPFLTTLRTCGLSSLNRNPDFYGDGLVLGNGEVSLKELTEAYSVLASDGVKRPLRFLANEKTVLREARIFEPDTTRLIALILSDPEARRREFGPLLSFPVQTAIKTGTSSDHRDTWALGFDHSHTVGIWMGNLDRSPTEGLAGASGPVPLLRAIFAELNRQQPGHALPLPRHLVQQDICIRENREGGCTGFRSEWLPPGTASTARFLAVEEESAIRLVRPPDGLLLAMDPRIPAERQRLGLAVEGVQEAARYVWHINDTLLGETLEPEIFWTLHPGTHDIRVDILRENKEKITRRAGIRIL